MKKLPLAILHLLLLGIAPASADPATEAFAQKYAKAVAEEDAAALQAMTFTEGASPDDLKKLKESSKSSLKLHPPRKATSVTIEPLENLMKEPFYPLIRNGKKTEPTLCPDGVIKIVYDNGGMSMTPYAIKNGTPWLIGFKSTKLNWNGPPEDCYHIQVSHYPGKKEINIMIECHYRASGMDLRKTMDRVLSCNSSSATAVFANELLSVKISTEEPDVTFEAEISKIDNGNELELSKQEISKEKPLLFPTAAPGDH